jgi:hypothetical protein
MACAAMLSVGCAGLRPTLTVRQVPNMPRLGGLLALQAWEKTTPLTVIAERGTGDLRETRPVQLRAMSDGRLLRLLVVWPDDVQSIERQAWVWDDSAETYRFDREEVDSCAVEWPLAGAGDFRHFAAREAMYDVWLWRAGWSDLSGMADDLRLEIEVHPPGAAPETVGTPLFWSADRKAKIAHRWTLDPGFPGTYDAPEPNYRRQPRVSGARVREGSGSVADVSSRGLYDMKQTALPNVWFVEGGSRAPGTWFGSDRDKEQQGFWLVEFQRALTTADKEGDVQVARGGTVRFAVGITDGEGLERALMTPPIRLRMF